MRVTSVCVPFNGLTIPKGVSQDALMQFLFAPTSVGGLGINYTITPEGWLYTVSHTQEQQAKVNTFVDTLKVGGKNLLEFLNA